MAGQIEDRSNRRLLKGIKNSSEKHFRQAFDLFHSRIYHTCRVMRLTHEECQEIVQETFLSIWLQRHKLKTSGSLSGLLFTIAKRLVIKSIREKVAIRKYSQNLNSGPEIANTTEDYVIYSDLSQHAQIGINSLPPQRKQIYVLSKQLGMSNKAISSKLGLSKRTVENQLYRATQHLRRFIEDENLLL